MDWISVDDKLPKQRQLVLLIDEDNWIFTGLLEGNEFRATYGDEVGTEVKYWMPLPAPPIEEEPYFERDYP